MYLNEIPDTDTKVTSPRAKLLRYFPFVFVYVRMSLLLEWRSVSLQLLNWRKPTTTCILNNFIRHKPLFGLSIRLRVCILIISTPERSHSRCIRSAETA